MKRKGMKRSAEDRRFSAFIRERDNYTCVRCGAVHLPESRGLHCAHIFGRGKLNTRFDPNNAVALCYGCHRWLDTHPDLKEQFFRDRMGGVAYTKLQLRSNQSTKRTSPPLQKGAR